MICLLDTRANKDLLGTFISDLVLQILSCVAEQERTFIKQRQKEGIASAKARNVVFGRPCIEKPKHFNEVVAQWKNKEITARKAMQLLNLKTYTFYKMVKNTQ